MRLLKLEKLRMPKQTRFRTFVLLLHPSMKPLDQGTSMEFKISWNQLRYALVQSENSDGHYFQDDYEAAKRDFTLRSNLVPKDALFEPERLA